MRMALSNPIHIAFLLVVLLLVFGAKRLPEMGRSLGAGMRDFKDAISGDGDGAADGPAALGTPQPAPTAARPAAAAPAPAPALATATTTAGPHLDEAA
jgi:sec-independent protein translocase protein TatA